MDCVIIAGGLPGPEDPIYAYTQGKPKALLDINGRTMLERVVDAVQSASQVEDVVIVGLGEDMDMSFKRPVTHLPDHGSLIKNGTAGLRWLMENKPGTSHALGVSGDVPLITGEMIDDMIKMCQPLDRTVYYNFITEPTMEARFPGSKRTYVKLKGLNIAGGDIVIAGAAILAEDDLLETLSNARKHAWKIARVVGLRVLLKLLFRRLSVQDIEETAERLINQPVKIILNPYAEMGMDADKPNQVDLVRAEFVKMEGQTGT
ncbi:MAG: NTP transferase domain-containing protein [Chloroflexi bacterium]|nr:NTP transferase domain-containing protein [Chloroflexota bacterium]